MKHNTQPNTIDINALIMEAQNATNDDVRSDAINELWKNCGNSVVNTMAGKSYTPDSDFSMRSFSPSERRANLMGDAFFVFYDAVMKFDANRGVPFMNYVNQKTTWQLSTDKRENTKHSMREKATDFSMECNSGYDTDSYDEANIMNILKNLQSTDDFEERCYRKDAVRAIKQHIKGNHRLLHYFTVCQEICNDGDTCSDAEVARHLGCSRANVGQLRRKLYQELAECDLIRDCRMLMAA